MTDDASILNRLDEERRTLARDGEVVDVLPRLTRLRAADGSHHLVMYSSLDEADAEAAVAGEVEHHRRLGVSFEWKLYAHDTPPGLVDVLRRHGFAVGPREAVLVYDLQQPPPWAADAGDEGGRVERVDRPEQLAAFRRVAEAVFGKDYTFTTTALADALRSGSTQHRGYVAYAGGVPGDASQAGEPVSVGRLYTHPDSWFAGLYGGGTVRAYRGRGLYRAVVAARARDAVAAGARYLIVDALPTSRPVLERLGFRRVTDTWPCEWTPGGEGDGGKTAAGGEAAADSQPEGARNGKRAGTDAIGS